MEKITLALIIVLLFGVKTIKGQEQKLSASEPISSGCLKRNGSNGEGAPALSTIKLTKEGSILSVDLLNYSSNCGTTGFEMENRISSDNGDSPSVVISVVPVVPYGGMDCDCPFNISYTLRGLEENKFYLTCWWYEGQVELTEGEPLVLEFKAEDAVIDGLKYRLLKTTHQAQLLCQTSWNGESQILEIPSEVEYEGEKYTVTSINDCVYGLNNAITKIIIPKTIKNTGFGSLEGITVNPFRGCLSLDAIEVEEGNPAVCSVEGVLFSKDMTTLLCYPSASHRESYMVPHKVATIAPSAFTSSKNLKRVILPNSIETLNFCSFSGCKSLEEVILSQNIKELPVYLFKDCTKLKSVVIPEGVTTIGYSAFEGCSSLDSVLLPESIIEVGMAAFADCTLLKRANLSPNLKRISLSMFKGCVQLAEVIIPSGITSIDRGAFYGCEALQSIDLPESIELIDGLSFGNIPNLKDVYCRATTVPQTDAQLTVFNKTELLNATLHVPAASITDYELTSPWNQFGAIVPLETQSAYRPFVEDSKVWKVGAVGPNPVQWVEYFYFDGDTIIDGRTCKQMMCQQYVSLDFPEYDAVTQQPLLSYVGAWYEENKKVYCYDPNDKQFLMKYDFSIDANDTLMIDGLAFAIGPKQMGDIKGFKGVYRGVTLCDGEARIYSPKWLEGVGSTDRPTTSVYPGPVDPMWFLMSCTVGDEVIYLNDLYEDGASPEIMRARNRFDFTHTIKSKPKAPMRREAEEPLYGEYNEQLLDINLNALDDAYLVRILDEAGNVVYKKTVDAGNVIGLNIDISSLAKGRYAVTMENDADCYTGIFEVQATGIEENVTFEKLKNDSIYNLQGQRFYTIEGKRAATLQQGIHIIKMGDGTTKKVAVK